MDGLQRSIDGGMVLGLECKLRELEFLGRHPQRAQPCTIILFRERQQRGIASR